MTNQLEAVREEIVRLSQLMEVDRARIISLQEQKATLKAARADAEARIEAYGMAVADTLEWLDGHAAPDVTEATIEAKLYAVQGIDAALADPPGRCEANTSGPRPECVTWECSLTSGHMGHHETEDGAASWTDGTTRYPDLPKQEAQRG